MEAEGWLRGRVRFYVGWLVGRMVIALRLRASTWAGTV